MPGLFSAFGTFLLRQSFLTLPRDFEEAAFVDGANYFTIFWRIVLPLSQTGAGDAGRVQLHGLVERLPVAAVRRPAGDSHDVCPSRWRRFRADRAP